jgi:hypothetical protein
MEWLTRLMAEHGDKAPFLTMVTRGTSMRVQVSVQRIVEAVIIGVSLAFVGYLAIIPRLEARIENIERNLARIERNIDQMRELREQDLRDQRGGERIHR